MIRNDLTLPRTLLVHNKIMPYRVPLFERLIDRYGIEVFVFDGDVPETFGYPDSVWTGDRSDLISRLWNGDYEVVVNPDVIFGEAHIDGLIATLQSMGVVQWTETWAKPNRSHRERLKTAVKLKLADLYTDQYIVPGTASATYVSAITGTAETDIHQIGNPTHIGCEETEYNSIHSATNRDPVTDDVPVVLFIGQVIERKGVDVLLEAVDRLDSDVDCQILIGGTGDEKYRARLDDQIQRAGLENVTFLGWIPEETLFEQYRAADVYVLPSRDDPWGISVVEAMKAGTPVVVSDAVGAAWDLVDGHDTGCMIPTEDAGALASCLETLLRDTELRTEMGNRAAELIESQITYHRMAETIRDAILRAAGTQPE